MSVAVDGRTAGVALIVVLAAWLCTADAAGRVAVESERHGDVIEVHATAVLSADPQTAWRVLTDYERFPAFIPDLHTSRLVGRRGLTAIVEQTGDVSLWPFRYPVHVTYEIQEAPPDRLDSRAVAGNLRALTSHYALTSGSAGTRLEYIGHVDTGFPIFRAIEQSSVERTVARQFRALADEIERQSGNPSTGASSGQK